MVFEVQAAVPNSMNMPKGPQWRVQRAAPTSSLLSGGSSFEPGLLAPQLRPDLLSSWDSRMDIPVKNTFIEFPNMTTPPYGTARVIRSCPPGAGKENEAGNLPNTSKLPFTPLKGEAEEDDEVSGEHPDCCKPCAWFHHARGCQRGANCEFCHLCPPGEIKRRKKDKYRLLRERRSGEKVCVPA